MAEEKIAEKATQSLSVYVSQISYDATEEDVRKVRRLIFVGGVLVVAVVLVAVETGFANISFPFPPESTFLMPTVTCPPFVSYTTSVTATVSAASLLSTSPTRKASKRPWT